MDDADDRRPVVTSRAVAFVDADGLTPGEVDRAIEAQLSALETGAIVTVHAGADSGVSVVAFVEAHTSLDVVTVLTESTGRIVVLRVG